MMNKESRLYMTIAIVVMLVTIVVAAIFGSADISINDFFRTIGSKMPFLSEDIRVESSHQIIIFNLRLPRIFLALFAGMGLAISGAVFQGVFSNPMAEPYLLGVSSGAAFGATIAAILEVNIRIFSFGAVSLFAFAGAAIVMMVIYKMTVIKGVLPVSVLILSGLAVNYFLSAIITLIMTFNQEKIEAVYFWTQGSFKNATWEKVIIVGIVVLVTVIYVYYYHRELDMITLSDDHAKSVGVEVDKVKKRLLIMTSLASAVIVSASGIIGFVGLIMPHGVRMITGPSHKKLIPLSAITGGIFLIICDTVARSVFDNKELSVGIITALCGVPFFLWLLFKNRRVI